MRLTSLRIRLIAVFALVALTAAVSASGIAYWLNRDAVLKRAQDSALNDFRDSLTRNVSEMPLAPDCRDLQALARVVASPPPGLNYQVVVVDAAHPDCTASSLPEQFTLARVPAALRAAVPVARPLGDGNSYRYHLYWQRVVLDGEPFLVGGTRIVPTGPTAYMFKSLGDERADLDTLAWSLGIAALLALVGSALLAQAASATVLRPVQRLGEAARRLGEGRWDTRLEVRGADELADVARTFNSTAEALAAQVEELSAREAASRRFVADMSHELRTPLTAMTAVTDILEDEADALDPMIEPAVRLVVSETRRLSDLVENLMEVTRFDAGTAKLVADEVDIADLIMSCIDGRAWFDAVELDAPRGMVARVDPRRLDVVFANLIGNALKHGGSPVVVRVRTEPRPAHVRTAEGRAVLPPEEQVVVEVRDSGPGIPEDVLPHVFDRFYKADKGRARSEGSGLGLSIAMENARIHGGTITAANAPAKPDGSPGGAVFTLVLPKEPSGGPDGGPADADPPGGSGGRGSAGGVGGAAGGAGVQDGSAGEGAGAGRGQR
ncbi:HAMP domain-containing histidine kinase [Streptacidiphilus sp. ASG 303]|uniref:sensor histidine kinase n=1 Tax=Streptacidiphilus sp. ASG 303 TaxID=2896847 RepID=UPI001E54C1AB|nr:HAMP domain-containing sensor histidine kinase [Streptacidiphilus sp. ASG 303]MCD0481845.1 HAMP domain-containing histidine kinase [Streptacidiphilus sp. ASG 303]